MIRRLVCHCCGNALGQFVDDNLRYPYFPEPRVVCFICRGGYPHDHRMFR